MNAASATRAGKDAIVSPSPGWAALVSGLTVIPLILLALSVTFAASPFEQHFGALNVARIVLVRGSCYGTCPMYSLTFDAAGNVVYDGQAFVGTSGKYRAPLDRREFKRLTDVLYSRGFFSTRALSKFVTDAPLTSISIVFENGQSVRTDFFDFFPDADDLWASALFLDGVANHICGWQRIAKPLRQPRHGSFTPIGAARCPDLRS